MTLVELIPTNKMLSDWWWWIKTVGIRQGHYIYWNPTKNILLGAYYCNMQITYIYKILQFIIIILSNRLNINSHHIFVLHVCEVPNMMFFTTNLLESYCKTRNLATSFTLPFSSFKLNLKQNTYRSDSRKPI